MNERFTLTEEQLRRRRRRSWAIALSLAALVALIFAISVVRIGPAILSRPL